MIRFTLQHENEGYPPSFPDNKQDTSCVNCVYALSGRITFFDALGHHHKETDLNICHNLLVKYPLIKAPNPPEDIPFAINNCSHIAFPVDQVSWLCNGRFFYHQLDLEEGT